MSRRRLLSLALVVASAALVADAGAQPKAAPAPAVVVTLAKGGEIRLELWPAEAPNHVKNFLELVGKGFYDGQRVHRVASGFVVQFGDPQSKTLPMDHPAMGTGGPGYTIKAEFNNHPFERGVLGMARTSDPNSAGSQVYIMLGPAPSLNGKYTAFGRVVNGMEVVDGIKVGDRITAIRAADR